MKSAVLVQLFPRTKRDLIVPKQFSVALEGDQRTAENLVLEVRAMAQHFGLEVSNVEITRQPTVTPKVEKKKARSHRNPKP